MERIVPLFAMLLACFSCWGRVICDTACHATEDDFRNYAVVSPVGRSMVSHIEQAPRLTTLDNKTIRNQTHHRGKFRERHCPID